jgi:replicative DNA helicase
MSQDHNEPSDEQAVLPPHATVAEQSILGGLLLDNHSIDRVLDLVKVQHFYDQEHRIIYQAILDLFVQNKPSDIITVSDWLTAKGLLEQAGGFAYLAEMANSAVSTAALTSYARIVRDKAVLRYLDSACNEIQQTIHSPGTKTPAQILENAEALMLRVSTAAGGQDEGPVLVREFLPEVLRNTTAAPAPSGLQGISTGLRSLDRIMLGLCPTDFIVIGGRPSQGKTALALSIAAHVGVKRALPVLIFSPETSKEQLSLRILSSMSGISHSSLRTRTISSVERDVFESAVSKLLVAPIYIDDAPLLGTTTLRARARRVAKKAGPLALVIIDYLQLMVSGDESDTATRNLEVQGICRAIKALAKELSVPVIALSQLNRVVTRRSDQRPILSDLRDSGSIEQDADVIVFIYREGATKPDEQPVAVVEEADLIVAKQRNGPIATVKVLFKPATHSFQDLQGQLL